MTDFENSPKTHAVKGIKTDLKRELEEHDVDCSGKELQLQQEALIEEGDDSDIYLYLFEIIRSLDISSIMDKVEQNAKLDERSNRKQISRKSQKISCKFQKNGRKIAIKLQITRRKVKKTM